MEDRNNDVYWALEEDPNDLADNLFEKIRAFFDQARSSFYYKVVARQWIYYHGFYYRLDNNFDWTANVSLSDSVIATYSNHVRSLVDTTYSMTTQQRPALQARARASDASSLERAKNGHKILDHYLKEQGHEEKLKLTAKHALLLLQGFIAPSWDPYAGPTEKIPVLGDDGELAVGKNGIPEYELQALGDFKGCNPTVFDMVFDPLVPRFDENQWMCYRTYDNRWEVAARADDNQTRRDVLNIEPGIDSSEEAHTQFGVLSNFCMDHQDTDIIPVWHFFHKDTIACPGGREFHFAGDGVPLSEPEPLGYDELPIMRVTADEIAMTQLGWGPVVDLHPLQELVNQELSTIATNSAGAGYNLIWVPDGGDLEEDRMGEGVLVVRGGQSPPSMVGMDIRNPGRHEFIKTLTSDMERHSGINSVARGQPEANFKSGKALQIMDAKAMLAVGPLQYSYLRCVERYGSFLLRTFYDRMEEGEEREVSVTDSNDPNPYLKFTKDDIDRLTKITVEPASPLLQTTSGRVHVADMLLSKGILRTPQEYLTMILTGNIEPLIAGEEAQLDGIHRENEALRRGEVVPVDFVNDNHLLHLREHGAEASNPDVRKNAHLHTNLLGHQLAHVNAFNNMGIASLQGAQGFYNVPGFQPPPPMTGQAAMAGMGQQGPGGPQMPGGAQGPQTPPDPSAGSSPEQVQQETVPTGVTATQ